MRAIRIALIDHHLQQLLKDSDDHLLNLGQAAPGVYLVNT